MNGAGLHSGHYYTVFMFDDVLACLQWWLCICSACFVWSVCFVSEYLCLLCLLCSLLSIYCISNTFQLPSKLYVYPA